MNHHARKTLIARLVSDDSQQHQVTAVWADIRNRTRQVLYGMLLLIALPWSLMTAAEDDGSPADLCRRIAELEAEVKILRTRAVPFTTLIKAKLGDFYLDGLKFDMTVPETPMVRIGDKTAMIMGLSNDERTSIDRIIQDTYARMAGEIAKLKPVLLRSGDGYRMEISGPIPDSVTIKLEFQRRAIDVLGAERFELWNLSDEWFFFFGANDQTFSIAPRKYPWGDSWGLEHDYHGDGIAGTNGMPLHFGIQMMAETSGGGSQFCGLKYIYPYLPSDFIAGVREAARKEQAWDRKEAELRIKKLEGQVPPPPEAVNDF